MKNVKMLVRYRINSKPTRYAQATITMPLLTNKNGLIQVKKMHCIADKYLRDVILPTIKDATSVRITTYYDKFLSEGRI